MSGWFWNNSPLQKKYYDVTGQNALHTQFIENLFISCGSVHEIKNKQLLKNSGILASKLNPIPRKCFGERRAACILVQNNIVV